METKEEKNLKNYFFLKQLRNNLIKNIDDKNIQEKSIEAIITKQLFYILAKGNIPEWTNTNDMIKDVEKRKEESNKIFVYLGNYKYDENNNFVKTENNNEIIYKLYGDLEEGIASLKRVPIKYCDIYEKEHFIINKDNAYSKELFVRLGKQYKKEVIKNSVAEANHKLLYK